MAMQVIWAIGASMVVLAGAQFLGAAPACFIGVASSLGHNLLDPVWPHTSAPADAVNDTGPLWAALHSPVARLWGPFRVRSRIRCCPGSA